MEILYRRDGDFVDIAGQSIRRRALCREGCGENCASAEITFEDLSVWERWGPQEDDEIIIREDGWQTGLLYVHSVIPEDGRCRLLATALPCRARQKEYRSYAGMTIADIMASCAARTGMGAAQYGVDRYIRIPYAQQEGESAAAFLHRLLLCEGAFFVCASGNYTAIDAIWAQAQEPALTLNIGHGQRGAIRRRSGVALSSLTVRTPFATASAMDIAVPVSHSALTVCGVPATDAVRAGRMARALLLHKNLLCDTLTLDTGFNPLMSALVRVDITGGTGADGQWLVLDAEHDLINRRTRAKLARCITSIL